MVAGCFTACNIVEEGTDTETSATTAADTVADSETESETVEEESEETTEAETKEFIDYAAEAKFDKNSGKAYAEVTVHTERNGDRITYGFVDGDTTHFDVPASVASAIGSDVLKARYLAVNTPESTGKIEEWGKKASKFTKEKLLSATEIILESDTAEWELDSTGDRHLVWIWYKDATMTEYRNLNIEILQNGLAIASSSANNRYGTTCTAALNQAKTEKLNVHSGEKDPDFFYGAAIPLTLKELKCNIADYEGQKVAFDAVVTRNEGTAVYVENYDEETNMYYGMYIFYGFNLSGDGMNILSVGNNVRIVGSVQYYETGESWQISDVQYRAMKPDDPMNLQKLDNEIHAPAYALTTADTFRNGTVNVVGEEDVKTYSYAELALYSSIEMKNLVVKSAYATTSSKDGSVTGISITCEVDGITVTVYTTALKDANGNDVTVDTFKGQTIDVKGLIDWHKTSSTANFPYQIKVLSHNDITILQ